MPKKKGVRPFPEAIDGSPWEVEDGKPKVTKSKHQMAVPLMKHPKAEAYRIRALAETKWIKPRESTASKESLDACRNSFLNYKINQAGIEHPAPLMHPLALQYYTEALELGILTPLEILQITANSINMPREEEIIFPLVQGVLGLIGMHPTALKTIFNENFFANYREGYEKNYGPESVAEWLEQLAQNLESAMGISADGEGEEEEWEDGEEEGEGKGKNRGKGGDWLTEDYEQTVEQSAKEFESIMNHYTTYGEEEDLQNPEYSTPDGKSNGRWAWMSIEKPDRPIPLPAKLAYRGPRADDMGVAFRFPHRYCTDMKVFARRRKKLGGGTVLIDCSGSMRLYPQDVYELLHVMPAATIAIYVGTQSEEGILRIVANKGRRVRKPDLEIGHLGGANQIDGPALYWLGHQPGPRYWVCDGVVTGPHDAVSKANFREAAELIKRYRIVRVDHPSSIYHLAPPELLKKAKLLGTVK